MTSTWLPPIIIFLAWAFPRTRCESVWGTATQAEIKSDLYPQSHFLKRRIYGSKDAKKTLQNKINSKLGNSSIGLYNYFIKQDTLFRHILFSILLGIPFFASINSLLSCISPIWQFWMAHRIFSHDDPICPASRLYVELGFL